MANMSYCRFNNTKLALEDCTDVLRERSSISSSEERENAEQMILEFLDFCEAEGIIADYDYNKAREIIEECNNQDE
jgi:hypothetical protein